MARKNRATIVRPASAWTLLLFTAFFALTLTAQSQPQAVRATPQAESPLPDAPVAQQSAPPQAAPDAPGSIHGTVVDSNGAVCQGAHVGLVWTPAAGGPPVARETQTDSDGAFSFPNVAAGKFKLTIGSRGFATQSISGALKEAETLATPTVTLAMNATTTDVEVTATTAEIAQEQLKEEETQRVFAVIPNFYVTYVPNAPPLTRRQKYQLAWRSSIDPVTFAVVGVVAGVEQGKNSFRGYGQGAEGYAKRYGAGYADAVDATFIGSAILASWWKQDPRYFYKGTGSNRSRALYAIAMAVMCKGDNGRWQVNYSGIVGGLAAGGISNVYYPSANRQGAGLTFENAALGTAGSAIGNLFQEFLVKHLTPHVPNYGAGKQ